jgi:hypothetical protein
VNTSKFAIGQTVEFLRGPSDGHVPQGTFTITRVMPRDSQDRSYRVRSSRDGQERVLTENQLRASSGGLAS